MSLRRAQANRAMEALGLKNQSELSRALGISAPVVSTALRSGGHLPATWIETLRTKHGLNPEWLLQGTGPKFLADAPSGASLAQVRADKDQAVADLAAAKADLSRARAADPAAPLPTPPCPRQPASNPAPSFARGAGGLPLLSAEVTVDTTGMIHSFAEAREMIFDLFQGARMADVAEGMSQDLAAYVSGTADPSTPLRILAGALALNRR